MKKCLSFILIFCFCFALISCGKIPNFSEDDTSSDTSSELNNILPEPDDPPLLTFESFDLYQKFIQTNQLPINFVPYSSISQFGDFVGLVVLSESRIGDYGFCMYTLMDDTGYEFVLYTDADPEDVVVELEPISSVDLTDMRTLDADSRGSYNHNGIQYCYVSGQLVCIVWENEGITYTLGGTDGGMLSDYPNANDSLVGQLLNAQTAAATLDSVFNIVN